MEKKFTIGIWRLPRGRSSTARGTASNVRMSTVIELSGKMRADKIARHKSAPTQLSRSDETALYKIEHDNSHVVIRNINFDKIIECHSIMSHQVE